MKFAFLIVSVLVPLANAQIYVSPNGSDGNAGTHNRPVRTLERARDLVRARNAQMAEDITVYLEGGTYRLSHPLMLNQRDSGSNGHSVIYRAVPGQKPMISGGVQITGWKLVDAKRNLWSAPAPADLKNTRQLYVNGIRAKRASGRLPVSVTPTETGYRASAPVMAGWKNPRDIEFVYTGGNAIWSQPSVGIGSWTEPRCDVASIHGTEITMVQPCWNNSTKRVMLQNGARTANLVGPKSVGKEPAYTENAFELLGTPGQWYFDRTAHVIYYIPRPGEDLQHADVEAPGLETLISGEGTASAPLHNITFSGIQFSYATWLFPSSNEGFSEIQANYMVTGSEGYAKQGLCKLAPDGTCPYGDWTKAPGSVSFRYGHQIQFINDNFVHLGAAGLDLGDGSQSDLVQGCVFTDISGNGLELGGVDAPKAPADKFTSNNRISNNHIYSIGAEFRGGIGIVVGYAKDTKIEHNQLDHLPYAVISMGWGGWPDKIEQAGIANNSEQNTVSNNLIFDYMLVLSDGGGIYTQGLTGKSLADGEHVTGNVLHDQFGSGHGIYTDNGSCNITVANNVILRTDHDNWGSRHKDYYDGQDGQNYDPLLIENNYWQQGDPDSSRGNVTEKANRLIDALNQAPADIVGKAGLEPSYKSILQERFGHTSAPEPPSRVAAALENGAAYITWNPSVFEGSSPVQLYIVTASNGAHASISAKDFQDKAYVKLTGLNGGGEYTFTVIAKNAVGASEPSLSSFPVKMSSHKAILPAAPANVKALAGEDAASIHFQMPPEAKDGTRYSPILAYAITINPGGRKVLFEGRRFVVLEGKHSTFGVVSGLKKGATYTFSVAAISAAGEGAAATTNPVTIQ